MIRGALCQVQNISTHATWKAGELKRSKAITTNAKDGNERNGVKTENQNLKRTLVNIGENLNETKVRIVEFLHESSNTSGNEQNGAKTENWDPKRTLINIEENWNETKVLELLHKSPNTVEVAMQTDVIVNTKLPELTAEDLRSSEVSANYWRRLEERLYVESEREAQINFELSIRLAKLNEEIAEKEEDYLALKHYISVKESIEHLNESELNENKEVERDENNIPENLIMSL